MAPKHRLQTSLLISSESKQINELLFPLMISRRMEVN